jgi:hypothetical protein
LVQAVSEKTADVFEFIDLPRTAENRDKDHGGWIEILDVSTPTRGAAGDPEDDGLPHTIIWCIDGNGTGSATGGEEIMITYEIISRTWSVDGEIVDDAGMSALLWV